MISCINCNRRAAVINGARLACTACGHEWTFQDETNSAAYLRRVLGREPITTPPTTPATPTSANARDDLTQLKGIQAARQHKINALGIFSYEQLATASVAAIVNNVGVDEATARQWIDAASALVDGETIEFEDGGDSPDEED